MFGLGWVPVLFVLVTFAGYIVPYIIALQFRHVYPILPAISDSGILLPESLVFREMMNLSGFLGIATSYIRYMQYQLITTLLGKDIVPVLVQKLNTIAVIVGVTGGLCVTFVGNFRAKKVKYHRK